MVDTKNISAVLISRNTLAREGLRRILDEDDFVVTESYESSEMLLGKPANDWSPDLIIVDELDSALISTEVGRLRHSYAQSRIVVLVDVFDFEKMVEAFKCGARGYIVKKLDCASLIGSLRLVAMGEKVMPSQLAEHLPNRLASSSAPAISGADFNELLSERELETMRHLLMGSPNKVIASKLAISEATVKVHVKAILRKLRVQNRTQAAIWAVNNGIDLSAPDAGGEVAMSNRLYA